MPRLDNNDEIIVEDDVQVEIVEDSINSSDGSKMVDHNDETKNEEQAGH